MENGKIFVVTHKKFQLSDELINKGYELITVGGKVTDNVGYTDCTLDNISIKNNNYCELTALYWIWKNCNDYQYKGLCHYRRYLTKSLFSNKEKSILSLHNSISILKSKKKDIILPQLCYFKGKSIKEQYLECGFLRDVELTRIVIEELYPEYIDAFDSVFEGNETYLTNIMIASSAIFDEYCEWLFNILFELEKRVDLSGYTVQEARIFGYLSERLLTVWVRYNNLNIKEFRMLNIENYDSVSIKNLIKQLLKRIGLYKTVRKIID